MLDKIKEKARSKKLWIAVGSLLAALGIATGVPAETWGSIASLIDAVITVAE